MNFTKNIGMLLLAIFLILDRPDVDRRHRHSADRHRRDRPDRGDHYSDREVKARALPRFNTLVFPIAGLAFREPFERRREPLGASFGALRFGQPGDVFLALAVIKRAKVARALSFRLSAAVRSFWNYQRRFFFPRSRTFRRLDAGFFNSAAFRA